MPGLRYHLALATIAFPAAMLATHLLDLGLALWHYNAAFVLLTGLGFGAWARLRRRRVASVSLAFFGAWSLLTGLALLYHVGLLGGEDWMMWWHAVASYAFLLGFVAHWARNGLRFRQLQRALLRRPAWSLPAVVAWTLIVSAAAVTAHPEVRAAFELSGHRTRATAALLALAAAGALAWGLLHRARGRPSGLPLGSRHRLRALVDGTLLLSLTLVTLTGFALVYAERFLLAHDAYVLTRWWHTAASGLLVAAVVQHVTFNARALRGHARRLDAELEAWSS